MPTLKYTTTIDGATLSHHAIEGDAGVDITALRKVKNISNDTVMYDTGICVEPPEGYYVELVARSSIVKTGWMLSNGIGIIDACYRGPVMIVLTRSSNTVNEIPLPFTVCQLILRPLLNINVVWVENLSETKRGSDGFGSTNVKENSDTN